MVTTTTTTGHLLGPAALQLPIEIRYPDPEWSNTTLNYYRDAPAPPPNESNSDLSTHEMRIARRSEDSPNVAKTPVRVRNIRGRESDYSIDIQGFCISKLESRMDPGNWLNDEQLKRVYFPEVSELLKRVTGAREVVQYEWHVRSQTLEESLEKGKGEGVDIKGPVRRVHIDESPASARREFEYYVKPDAEMRGRHWGIFNVWKPLKPIRRDPLCLCDARTIRDEDLQLGRITVPNVGEIENFAVRAPEAERHEFCYVRGQKADEALVFRIFDSRLDGGVEGEKRSFGVAHTSFVDPGTEGEEARESVEVRNFCIF